MSSVGVKIDQFSIPVCNSFEAKIVKDQFCYEVDLNKFSNKLNVEKELKLGFNFLMDYNEDRHVSFDENINTVKIDKSLAVQMIESEDDTYASIFLNTVGKCKHLIM